MVEAVAQHVDERIAKRLDDRLVGLGILAFKRQFDLLAQLPRHVAYEPGKALEHNRDRHHADLHDGILHFLGHAVDYGVLRLDLARHVAAAVHCLCAPGEERQRVARHHHLADQAHEPIDLALIDAQAA